MFSGGSQNPQGMGEVVAVADEIGRQATQGRDPNSGEGSVGGGATREVATPNPRLTFRQRWHRFRMQLSVWRQNRRFRKAVRLVQKYDGLVVSNAAFQVALDRLASFAEWADQMRLSRRLYESHSSHVEDIVRALVLAGEIGDYTLQLQGREQRYINLRYRAMTQRQRQRLNLEAALKAMEARGAKLRADARNAKQPAPPQQEVMPDGRPV